MYSTLDEVFRLLGGISAPKRSYKTQNVYSKSVHFGLKKIIFLMQNTWEYCVYSKIFPDAKSLRVLYVFSKICNADNQPSWPKCVQFSRRVEKNVGNVSKFGSPRMSLFLPKIIVVDCIEKMSEEIPDRLGSTAYLLNLMKAFCTHCCIQYYWLQVSAFWTQNTIREWEQISPKKNKTKPHCFSPRNLRAEKKP